MNLTQRPIYQKGQKPAVVPALRNASRGQQCTLAIPGICAGDPARVVGCHLRMFGIAGAAQKPDDLFIIDACDCCHTVLDNRARWAEAALGWDDILRALIRTQSNRRAAGLIRLPGE